MRFTHLLAAAIIVFTGASPSLVQAQNQRGGYAGPGSYEIANEASGKVLDLNRQDQCTVVQGPRHNSPSQQWDIEETRDGYVTIKSAATGLAIDVDGGRARDGARVMTAQPVGSESQFWKIEGRGSEVRFTSRLGKSLDLPHGSRDDGVEYQIYEGAGQDNQRFRLTWISALVQTQNGFDDDRRRGKISEEKRAYDRGYKFGVEDFKARMRRTYARHKGDYNSQWEESFIEGYYDGYDAARPDTTVMRSDEKDLYDAAYRSGQSDYRGGREPHYSRYSDRFDSRSEPFFPRGSTDGYYSSR